MNQLGLSKNLYPVAWNILYSCFSEQMNQEALDLMDSVEQSVRLDEEEYEDENTRLQ